MTLGFKDHIAARRMTLLDQFCLFVAKHYPRNPCPPQAEFLYETMYLLYKPPSTSATLNMAPDNPVLNTRSFHTRDKSCLISASSISVSYNVPETRQLF